MLEIACRADAGREYDFWKVNKMSSVAFIKYIRKIEPLSKNSKWDKKNSKLLHIEREIFFKNFS